MIGNSNQMLLTFSGCCLGFTVLHSQAIRIIFWTALSTKNYERSRKKRVQPKKKTPGFFLLEVFMFIGMRFTEVYHDSRFIHKTIQFMLIIDVTGTCEL